MVPVCLRLAAAGLTAAAFLPSTAIAQDEADFYKAYYLEHEKGDLEAARALYLEVADDRGVASSMREEASRNADALGEDLASSDFTRLVPRDTIFYAELSRPGEQLSMLLDQLGLLGSISEGKGLGVSPLLVDGILGMRGAAVAVTEVNPEGMPNGVLLLHPGDLDVVRGLIETALPAAGQPVEPIHGFPTWSFEGMVQVTLTNRLVLASPDRGEIEGVLERMRGDGGPSLADNDSLRDVLERNDDGLFSFCVNAEPIMPMIQGMLAQEAANDPEAAMMLAFLDVQSLRSISGHVGVDKEGVNLEVAVELAEGHRNLAFNLLRLPQVERATLEQIPSGAAFFVSLGLNPEGGSSPIARDSQGQAVVSFMDFGRELFGNLVDVTVYGLPSESSPAPIPDVAAILRVNDVERSKALWGFVLGSAGGASGGEMEPASVKIAGRPVDRYSLGGVPVYLAASANSVVVSPSKSAVERALKAGKSDSSIMDDPVFAADVKRIDEGHTIVAMANPGRCIDFASGMMGPGELEEMAPFADLLADTVITFGLEHTDTRLGIKARVSGVPDVSGLVAEAIHGAKGEWSGDRYASRGGSFPIEASAPPPEAGQSLMSLRSNFERLATEGEHAAANQLGREILDEAFDDPFYLNNLAWTISTEDPYQGNYVELAMMLAERANEASEYSNWYYVDTFALVMFQVGEVKEAVRLSKLAVELAGDDSRGDEAREALKRYEAALEPPVVSSTGGS